MRDEHTGIRSPSPTWRWQAPGKASSSRTRSARASACRLGIPSRASSACCTTCWRSRQDYRTPATQGLACTHRLAIPLLLRKLAEAGAEQARLCICAAGGAEVLAGTLATTIGQRNRTMLRKILWRLGLSLAAESTGGRAARTMCLDLETGTVRVHSSDSAHVLWQPGMHVTGPRTNEP
ncbi:MAG: hypothetical protein ABIP94_04790 [Planctomycetota bacterium]